MYWREERSTRDSVVEATRAKFAALIGGHEGDVAIVKNVSEGINAIATAFDWRPGDNVVLCASLEHPNNVIPWLHLKRRGVEVRIVPPSDGAIGPQQIIASIDEHTRVVTCSSVTFAPGLRTDLAPIGRACRDRGVFFLVDAVQSVGILQLNVEVEFHRRTCRLDSQGAARPLRHGFSLLSAPLGTTACAGVLVPTCGGPSPG